MLLLFDDCPPFIVMDEVPEEEVDPVPFPVILMDVLPELLDDPEPPGRVIVVCEPELVPVDAFPP